MSDVRQIQHDASTGLDQLMHFGSKNVSALAHQASGATNHDGVRRNVDFKAELLRTADTRLRHDRTKINHKDVETQRAFVPLCLCGFCYWGATRKSLTLGGITARSVG